VGPDLGLLATGDIVLIAGSTKRGQPVRLYQRSWGYAVEQAAWTHAALFLAEDRVVHARPAAFTDGVVIESLFDAWTHGSAAFLRDPTVTEADRMRLGIRAASKCGVAYDRMAIQLALGDFVARRLGIANGLSSQAGRIVMEPEATVGLATSTTCARLIQEVYGEVLGERGPRIAGPAPIPLPADLAVAGAFADVDLPVVRY
jgi:hypothetical protein